jgi:predicted alpha/beta hydrolase
VFGENEALSSLFVPTADGWRLSVNVFEPKRSPQNSVLLIFPAMGAPARAYHRVAEAFEQKGYPVVAVDSRGTGESKPTPSRRVDYGMDAYLYADWPAVVDWVRRRYPDRRLILFGHSLGGQLSALYSGLHPGHEDALILLASGSADYRNWDVPYRWGAWALYRSFCLLSRAFGYLPGQRVGWGCAIARTVVKDWARWGMTGRYVGTRGEEWDSLFGRVTIPVLAISFSDDRILAPRRSVDDLIRRLRHAALTRWHLTPSELGRKTVGHFGSLKGGDLLWEKVHGWLETEVT